MDLHTKQNKKLQNPLFPNMQCDRVCCNKYTEGTKKIQDTLVSILCLLYHLPLFLSPEHTTGPLSHWSDFKDFDCVS